MGKTYGPDGGTFGVRSTVHSSAQIMVADYDHRFQGRVGRLSTRDLPADVVPGS